MTSKRFRPALPFLAFCCLTGCVSAEHRQADIALPSTLSAYDAQGATEALDRWWLLFGDDQLTRLVTEALDQAPDAKTALAVLDQARATRRQAMLRFMPAGDANGSGSFERTSTNGVPAINQGLYNGAFSPSWELGLFGRGEALHASAEADLQTAEFKFHASRQSLASSVAGDLFEARANAVRLAQARDTLRIAEDLARLGERRVAAGLGAPSDTASLQSDEATARASVRLAEANLEVSKRTLLVLLGRGREAVDTLAIEANLGNAPGIPAATPASLLARRPDIRQAEAELRSAAGTLKLNALDLLPKFSLTGQVNQTLLTGLGGYSTGLWSLGGAAVMPVLSRTRLLAQVRLQRARTEQAVIAYENAVQSGFADAQNTLAIYGADQRRLIDLVRAEERARFAFDAQTRGYRRGVTDLTSLLQTERTWRASLSTLSTGRASALVDAVNVFQALGGGWPSGEANAPTPDTMTKGRVS